MTEGLGAEEKSAPSFISAVLGTQLVGTCRGNKRQPINGSVNAAEGLKSIAQLFSCRAVRNNRSALHAYPKNMPLDIPCQTAGFARSTEDHSESVARRIPDSHLFFIPLGDPNPVAVAGHADYVGLRIGLRHFRVPRRIDDQSLDNIAVVRVIQTSLEADHLLVAAFGRERVASRLNGRQHGWRQVNADFLKGVASHTSHRFRLSRPQES